MLFSLSNTLFTVWGYAVSYLEFFGWLSGLVAVALSAKANIWSWPIGLINVTLSFFLFYQVQLYPDMLLQVFFFVTNLMGWWRWLHPKKNEADQRQQLKVSWMLPRQRTVVVLVGVTGTVVMGTLAARLHEWFPALFSQPSAAPYVDSFITVMSVITTFYMIEKKIECWAIWILVDVIATYLYFVRDIRFYSLLYLLFTLIAMYGLLNWWREYKQYPAT
jgi:nicotinamide mononucleotide transporter